MKEILKIEKEHEVLSLASNIAFTDVPAWYGSTRKNLHMDIIFPKANEGHAKMPTVVWICGGAYMTVDHSVWIPEMIRIARAGFVVASIEYRTTNEVGFPAALIDAKSAIRFLKAHANEYCVDPDQVFVMGESAGGALAALIGTTAGQKEFDQGDFLEYDSSVRGVVNFYGGGNMTKFQAKLEKDSIVPYWFAEAYLGVNYSEETARRASASEYIDENTPPFLIVHGTEDSLVDFRQSEYMYEVLEKHGIPVEFIVVEGAAHGDDLCYQNVIIEKIIKFLKKNCK